MTPYNLIDYLKRMYASVDAAAEFNLNKFPAKIIQNEKLFGMYQDFSGGLSQPEIENIACIFIHNIANLLNHIKRWAKESGSDKVDIVAAYNKPLDLQIIEDLHNNNKHGYPPRNKGNSGLMPQLINITNALKISGSTVVTMGASGIPNINKGGSALVVNTGEIVDKNGDNLVDKDGNSKGDLYDVEIQAVESLDKLLQDLGVSL